MKDFIIEQKNNVNQGFESLAFLKPKDLEYHKNFKNQIPYLSLKLQLKYETQVHAFGDQEKYTNAIQDIQRLNEKKDHPKTRNSVPVQKQNCKQTVNNYRRASLRLIFYKIFEKLTFNSTFLFLKEKKVSKQQPVRIYSNGNLLKSVYLNYAEFF